MLSNEMLRTVGITKNRSARRTGRQQLWMAPSRAVIVLLSCWVAFGKGSSEAVTATTAAPVAGETNINAARDEFLQSLLSELSKHPDVSYEAFQILWKREQQPLQRCSTNGLMYCFNRPAVRFSSGQQTQRSGQRAVLVVAAVPQQTEGKPLCEDRNWTAQVCVGTHCFNQTLHNFIRCQNEGKAALVDATELLADAAASSTAELPQGEDDGLCIRLVSETGGAQARSTGTNTTAHSDVILLVYNGDDKATGVRTVLAATEMATLGMVTACGQPASFAGLHSASVGDNRQLQHSRLASSTQLAGSDERIPVSPLASHDQRRHARRTPYTGLLGPCALRPWTISYDDVPNDLFVRKPYFPRVVTINYCVGSCQALLPHASLNFTRHSFLRTRQFGDAVTGILVPKPCCVPVAFLTTAAAFIDRTGVIRIEMQEDASVSACGCR